MPLEKHPDCIESCNDCALACDFCAHASLAGTDVAMLSRCIKLNIDCATICRLAVAAMGRGSELTVEICALCAEACDVCAYECERHDFDHCRWCAAACRRTAEACRHMGVVAPRTVQSIPMSAH